VNTNLSKLFTLITFRNPSVCILFY